MVAPGILGNPFRAYQRQRAARRRTSVTKTIAAPVGGLNARDSIAEMPETDALMMVNWFPQPTLIDTRNGSVSQSTGLPGWVETLADYRSATAHKIFAWSVTAVYDVTSVGAVGAAVVTGLTNARWEYTNISTTGGQFLYAANAVDKPLYYDGSAWVKVDGASTPAITGVTTTLLRNPIVWKNRLWFVENNSFRAWYLPIQSVGGAASSINLGEVYRLGGALQAIMAFTLNNGNTFDEYIGFLSTEGELAVYGGTDPDFAGTFGLVGLYRFGRPIGRRCWFRVGSDAVIICSDGFLPVSKIVYQGETGQNQTISYKILNLVNNDIAAYSGNFGWEGQLYPLGNKIIINVPTSENSSQYQYVMNTITQAWTKFTGWNAACWLVSRDTLYYGGNQVVISADVATSNDDLGAAINCTVQPAFNYFDTDGQKLFKMVRPIFQVNGSMAPILSLNVDFNTMAPTGTPSFVDGSGSPWDTSPWDTSPWSYGMVLQKNWQSAPGIGFSATINMNLNTKVDCRLLSVDYLYESGGVL